MFKLSGSERRCHFSATFYVEIIIKPGLKPQAFKIVVATADGFGS
jgi:hypothetical protein